MPRDPLRPREPQQARELQQAREPQQAREREPQRAREPQHFDTGDTSIIALLSAMLWSELMGGLGGWLVMINREIRPLTFPIGENQL